MECLETGKICPTNNLKCKQCKFEDCRKVLEMIDYDNKKNKEKKIKLLKEQLDNYCKNCSFLEIINLKDQKVRCSYRIKNKCLLKNI